MSKQINAIKGMNDILPPESARWEWLEAIVRRVMAEHAYRNVRMPIMEQTQLYTRGLGEVTDIVEKEMYAFEDRADQHGRADHLALRPEGTAGLVRAVAEHNLLYDGGKRLYYMGPMFRRERPQRGRYRQFHQIGAEALGFGGPEVDAELILLAVALWRELGIQNWRLELNSLGQPDERREHRAALIAYFEALYSAFSRMHVQKTWDGILNTPISLDDVVLAEMLWAGFKALFSVIAILGVMLALKISLSPKLILVPPILLIAGVTFASMALVFNAKAKGYDFFTYYFAVLLSPMMFLSGVFFPLEQLPESVRLVSQWLPLSSAVALVRPLFMDQWPQHPLRHGLVMVLTTAAAYWVALALTRRRFRG